MKFLKITELNRAGWLLDAILPPRLCQLWSFDQIWKMPNVRVQCTVYMRICLLRIFIAHYFLTGGRALHFIYQDSYLRKRNSSCRKINTTRLKISNSAKYCKVASYTAKVFTLILHLCFFWFTYFKIKIYRWTQIGILNICDMRIFCPLLWNESLINFFRNYSVTWFVFKVKE